MLEKIPNELLITIFGFLNYEDVKALRQTCKNCYYASLAYPIIKNEILKLDSRTLKEKGGQIIDGLRKTYRSYYHVKISNIDHDNFWIFEKFGLNIKSIFFNNYSGSFPQFCDILLKLENLEKLSIINCTNLLMDIPTVLLDCEDPELTQVKSLEICCTQYLTDAALSRFFKICPNVEHLSISATKLNCHAGVYQFNYKTGTDILSKPSANVLTAQFVKALITSKRNQITSLNFACTLITYAALEAILHIKDLKLSCLDLTYCGELRQNFAIRIGITWHWQSSLTELQFAGCCLVGDTFLEEISVSLPNLKILNLANNHRVGDYGFRHIRNFNSIIELDISNCISISSAVFVEVLSSKNIAATLRILRMSSIRITDDDFISLMYALQLTELKIAPCKLTNYSMSNIFMTQKSLKKLSFGSYAITDSGLTGLHESKLSLPNIDLKIYHNMQIEELVIQDEINIRSRTLYGEITTFMNRSLYCLEDLLTLESLNLSQCCELSDHIFCIPTRLNNLKKINFSGLRRLTSRALFLLPHNCPSLEIVNLSNTSVDDIGICILVRLHHLKQLYLNNTLITNVSLKYILQHCKQLQILNIDGCKELCSELLVQITNLPTMKRIVGRSAIKVEMNVSTIPLPPIECSIAPLI